MSRIAFKLTSLLLVIFSTTLSHAQVTERRGSPPPGGYQLKYVPIPPKSKRVDPPPAPRATAENRKDTDSERRSKQIRYHSPSPEQLRLDVEQHATKSDPNADIALVVQAARQNSYNERVQRQQELADIYDLTYRASLAEAQAQYFQQQSQQPAVYIIRPYDPISDYWGIYAPRRHRGQAWVITSP